MEMTKWSIDLIQVLTSSAQYEGTEQAEGKEGAAQSATFISVYRGYKAEYNFDFNLLYVQG